MQFNYNLACNKYKFLRIIIQSALANLTTIEKFLSYGDFVLVTQHLEKDYLQGFGAG